MKPTPPPFCAGCTALRRTPCGYPTPLARFITFPVTTNRILPSMRHRMGSIFSSVSNAGLSVFKTFPLPVSIWISRAATVTAGVKPYLSRAGAPPFDIAYRHKYVYSILSFSPPLQTPTNARTKRGGTKERREGLLPYTVRVYNICHVIPATVSPCRNSPNVAGGTRVARCLHVQHGLRTNESLPPSHCLI